MKNFLAGAAILAAAGCSCAPTASDANPQALWGDRMSAYRALADAKNAAIDTTTTPFTALHDTSSDAYQARRAVLSQEIDRAQARLDQAECALDRARR